MNGQCYCSYGTSIPSGAQVCGTTVSCQYGAYAEAETMGVFPQGNGCKNGQCYSGCNAGSTFFFASSGLAYCIAEQCSSPLVPRVAADGNGIRCIDVSGAGCSGPGQIFNKFDGSCRCDNSNGYAGSGSTCVKCPSGSQVVNGQCICNPRSGGNSDSGFSLSYISSSNTCGCPAGTQQCWYNAIKSPSKRLMSSLSCI